MKLISIFFVTAIILTSCNGQASTVKDPSIDLREGILTYSVSGKGTTSSWELEVSFNPDNAIIREQYARGAARKYIYDKKSNEILGLIDDAASLGIKKGSYCIYYTPEELVKLQLSSNYGDTTITMTEEFKDILGYKCQKSIIKHGKQVIVEVWLTDKIKPGIIYPWTPLTFESVALEYEIKILGKTDRRYVIKSISDETINKTEFEHIVPDPYNLVIPYSEFSIDSFWANDYEENRYRSFAYPYYGNGRDSTIQFMKNGLYKIIKEESETDLVIEFLVNKDGTISDIEVRINYQTEDKRIEEITRFLKSMKPWTPAKVKGNPVKSIVVIIA